MGDEDKRSAARLPFKPPPPPPAAPSKKLPTSKQQLKRAKKNKKSAISVRNLFTGLFLLIIVAVAVAGVISPNLIKTLTSGEFIKNTEICEVTETNSSIFFDSSCGKFEWDKSIVPGSPSENLVKGQTYEFSSTGLRFGPASIFPVVSAYKPAPAQAPK